MKSQLIAFILFLAFFIFSCQKGEHIETFQKFTNVFIKDINLLIGPDKGKLLIDEHAVSVNNNSIVKIISGEKKFTLLDSAGNIIFNETIIIKDNTDTLQYVKLTNDIPPSLIKMKAESRVEGKVKIRIVNGNNELNTLLGGKKFHLVFYHVVERLSGPPSRRRIVYSAKGDTLKNIGKTLPADYQSLTLPSADVLYNYGFYGRAQILKEDFKPLLINGMEAYYGYSVDYHNYGVLTSFTTNNSGTANSPASNIPTFWEFNGLEVAFGN
ncbi:hypothetical protein [Sphingobacterium ginsenosidimutans]|uniref:DUF4249 family protein n=1 Tax=Sphingobacterium ginsenosidimutans TaxID=687845 RepID=A0ABP7ZPL6_9SPHI